MVYEIIRLGRIGTPRSTDCLRANDGRALARAPLKLHRKGRCSLSISSWLLPLVFAAGAGCTTSADTQTRQLSAALDSASRQAIECRSAISNKPEHRTIAVHLPLVDVSRATLAEMLDTNLINQDDYRTLIEWQKDVRRCQSETMNVLQRSAPVYLPIVLAAWNKDDEVFILLARRKVTWGDALMRLKANRAELLANLAGQMARTEAALNETKQATLDRRASALEALIGLVP